MPKQKPWKCSACGAEVPDLPMSVLRHQLSHVERRGRAVDRIEPDGPARRGPTAAPLTTPAPPRTFADLEPAGLELAVTCQRCGHVAVVDDASPKLRHQRLAGRRYRCARCGAIGLPSLGARRLAQHAASRPV